MFDFLKKLIKQKPDEGKTDGQIKPSEAKTEKKLEIPGISAERLEQIKKESHEKISAQKTETKKTEELLPKLIAAHAEKIKEKVKEKPAEEKPEKRIKKEIKPVQLEQPKKVGFFESITQFISEVKLTDNSFENLFSEFELNLLQNNVALEVVEKMRDHLKYEIVGKSIKRSELAEKVKTSLRYLVISFFERPGEINLISLPAKKKPCVIIFVGVNGVGKTTAVAKVGKWIQNKGKSCVFAASDTFRAAAIEQLETHADKLGIKLIKHKYGADAAAVAFDAIDHAKAKGIDFVLIDTAGRSHSNADLMTELQKIKRVANPDLTVLVVDSLTGNDAVEQARNFNDKIGIDCTILTKTDADEKGGAVISVAYITQKPILFLGTGQRYEDLKAFNSKEYVEKII